MAWQSLQALFEDRLTDAGWRAGHLRTTSSIEAGGGGGLLLHGASLRDAVYMPFENLSTTYGTLKGARSTCALDDRGVHLPPRPSGSGKTTL